jgi:protease-4
LLGRCFASVASGFIILTLRLERKVIFLHSLRLMKKSGCLPLFLIVLLGLSLFANLVLLIALGSRGAGPANVIMEKKFTETTLVPGHDSQDKIALIPLDGLISYGFGRGSSSGDSMVNNMKDAFQQAANDPKVKAIVISVDSPGGEVTAGDTIYHALGKLSAKKPVVIFMNSIGTSAAYYIACAGSWIMCSDTTFTGSIGVIISTLNYKELFGKIGLQSVIFKSGKFKDALNGARDLTEEERSYFQGLVMQTYDRFLGIVASARKLDPELLRDGIADGRVMSGKDAYAAKLIDQLGYIEDAYEKARTLGKSPGAEIVRYEKKRGLGRLLRFFEDSEKSDIHLDLNMGGASGVKLESGRLYLLPAFYAL